MGGRDVVPTIRLRYVQSYPDRSGRMHHYFRRFGRKVALPGLLGSPEFMTAYAAALAERAPEPMKRQPVKDGTFAALALSYFASSAFKALGPATKVVYRGVIDQIVAEHGHRPVAAMRPNHVSVILGAKAEKPGAAQSYLKRLRTLLKHARALSWISGDPTMGATLFQTQERHTWTEEELAVFEARWPLGSRQRLAYALCLYTGQRGSDVRRMGWQDIADGAIRVRQQKTGTRLAVAIHPTLQKALDLAARDHLAILTTNQGAPFTQKGFQNYLSDAIKAAGLPDRCKAHGLRKAAARRLAEAGCSAHEIMALTGHKSLSEVERYTRAAGQVRLGQAALAKQLANEKMSTVANPTVHHIEKTARKS